jgi:hypothetical protein
MPVGVVIGPPAVPKAAGVEIFVHGIESHINRDVVVSCPVESQGKSVVASDEVVHRPIRDTPHGPTMVAGGVQRGQDHPKVLLVGELVPVEAGQVDPFVVIVSDFDEPGIFARVHCVEMCDVPTCVPATEFFHADRVDALADFRIGEGRSVHLTRLARIPASRNPNCDADRQISRGNSVVASSEQTPTHDEPARDRTHTATGATADTGEV